MEISFDTQLRALHSVERRRILAALLAGGAAGTVALTSLSQTTGGDSSRELIELHHVHVPLLVELGLVARADGGDTIRRGDAFGEVRPLLDLLVTNSDEWPGEWGTPVPPYN